MNLLEFSVLIFAIALASPLISRVVQALASIIIGLFQGATDRVHVTYTDAAGVKHEKDIKVSNFAEFVIQLEKERGVMGKIKHD